MLVRVIAILVLFLIAPYALGQQVVAQAHNPQLHLMALEDMTAATNSHLEQSLDREHRMQSFIEANGLGEAFDTFPAPEDHPMSMSFGEALHQSVINVQSARVKPQVGSADLQRQINAYEKLAHASWDRLQASMTAVHRMSSFLESQDKMQDYVSWASDKAAAEHQAVLDDGEQHAAMQRTHQAHVKQLIDYRQAAFEKSTAEQRQQQLKWRWDQYKHRVDHTGRSAIYTKDAYVKDPYVRDPYVSNPYVQHPYVQNAYDGYGNYSDQYFDSDGWGLGPTGRIIPYGTTITK